MKDKLFFALALFAAGTVFLCAEENGPVVQRLSWQPVDYVSHYEVRVEVFTSLDQWIETIRRTSETETYVDCPLFIGRYRFRVIAYDLADRLGSATDWVYFEVRRPEEETLPAKTPPVSAGILSEEAIQEILNALQAKPPAPEENEKSFFRLELAAAPLIVLPFSNFNELYSTAPFQPLGFALRLAALPFVTNIGVFGLEFAPSWNFMANDILHKSRSTHITSGHLSVIWQTRPFNRNTALDLRLGGGMSYINSQFDFNYGENIASVVAWNPSLIAGVSVITFFSKNLYLDIGFEYYHILAPDNMALNYLRPSAGLGWWF